MMNSVLIGNCFSLTLIRGHEVVIRQCDLAELRDVVSQGAEVSSFWGHENTRAVAENAIGFSLKPKIDRPAIVLSSDGLPTLDGKTYDACWVLSPDYIPGYRPKIGEEVGDDKITGWQLLKLTWKTNPKGNC